MKKILVVYGTRPEAIKVAPVILALQQHRELQPIAVVTGQHREILHQVNQLFAITPDEDLDILRPGQTLEDITAACLQGLAPIMESHQPDAVLLQGDTTTCFAAALSGFYHHVPVVHLEAGLRTGDRHNPFPEELNRRLTTQLAALHLAPTSVARDNLLAEGIDHHDIVVTGNTVIDALALTVSRPHTNSDPRVAAAMQHPYVLVTTHRRESWGAPMRRTAQAIAELAALFPDKRYIIPAHPNPIVRDALQPVLADLPNVVITDPMGYADFTSAMAKCELVLTDSGGIQEEAPHLGKPVLVLRDNTERPEAISAGTAKLVGTDTARIVAEVRTLLTDQVAYDQMAHAENPYGDGQAALRSVRAIEFLLGLAAKPADFAV